MNPYHRTLRQQRQLEADEALGVELAAERAQHEDREAKAAEHAIDDDEADGGPQRRAATATLRRKAEFERETMARIQD